MWHPIPIASAAKGYLMSNTNTARRVRVVSTGTVETVLTADDVRVVTHESARQLNWYHPSKVRVLP